MDKAIKADDGKAQIHLIPPEIVFSIADGLAYGAAKYSPRNWELGFDYSRVFSALQRHLWAWFSGEDNDPESGLSHLDHAACCIAFLVTFERRSVGNDDRPVRNK